MRDLKPTYRMAERNAVCRSCNKTIEKGEKMVSWWSYLNSGMWIHLCKDCCASIYTLTLDDKNAPDIQADI